MQREKFLAVNDHFQLQYEEKQNCYVLLYPEGMVQLSFSAGEIMSLCDGTKSCEDIIGELTQKFSNDSIAADIVEFLDEAVSRDWIVYHEA
ncbi:pyrroloquinoline quinone biosynthesis peptide chaperone PqqD [Sulfuricurvum sp.]|uniref:pyrroloquinoline quinone biosynthesis peptide chaperone PqqD n=1 Tax=Sulfuricurvum sp. TaxID=2025608 RepID=UPI00261C7E35|nr:pyrroloquinoline quinone biosynthesis peptide chaperone PqqD [Sulfuricurvum sp.]MDD2266768.1 pyrroloquinoline quinone biosynthesis peptide chaperone PqqD [Sulfuricurvum sp.]MDD2784591.1 pyrroloquinoline quinone biosynthesis peptide chaperone PqqD [Sulfuricurvum sp.]HZF71600.1 pyrroloquinoline quinone biosynthesis peptide chaperone PqqD [Sulfuricurvum sp.]